MIRELEAGPPARPAAAPQPHAARERRLTAVEALAGAERRHTPAGTLTYREVVRPLDSVVGRQPLQLLAAVTGHALSLLAPDQALSDVTPQQLLFLDIESTGLGGAGAITFLVTTARIEQAALVSRQYLAESPAEEAALMDALIADARLADNPVLVTYNGRTFDAPVLDSRAIMHRRRAGFEALRHLDLLPPARAVYRGWLPSCRLTVVAAEVLGHQRPEDDVPGAHVPGWYFSYLRGGDGRLLEPLARHNDDDVLELAALLARMSGLLDGTVAAEGPEALGVGRLLHRMRNPQARAHFARAARQLPPGSLRDEALTLLADLHKRAGRHDLAEPLWQAVSERGGAGAIAAHEELAKFYEHRLHRFARAAAVVEAALALVERAIAPTDRAQAERWRTALHHRLARLHSRADRTRARAS